MIWLTQWLCPNRHTSIALAWDDQSTTAEQIEEEGESIYKKGLLNHWCGICRGELHVEHGRTRFKTMEEAQPYLERIQQAYLVARAIIGG